MFSLGAGEPILQRQEIGAHVLGAARDEAQDLRDAPQHRHLLARREASFLPPPPRSRLSREIAPRSAAVHAERAEPRQLDDLARRHAADDGVAGLAARLERRQHRLDVVLHEQHGGDDDVGLRDVRAAAFERFRIASPLGGGVQGEREARQLARELGAGALDRAGEVTVQRHDRRPGRARRQRLKCALASYSVSRVMA